MGNTETKDILHIIMSCNRPEYLIPTLKTRIDFKKHNVYRVLIDDYPENRNNELFHTLCKTYNIDRLILNEQNKGLSSVWSYLWKEYKGKFDYIFHQEDDVILKEYVDVDTLISVIEKNICAVTLTRQPWYSRDIPPTKKEDDTLVGNYRYELREEVFSPMYTLYPGWVLQLPIIEYCNSALNEGLIMRYLEKRGFKVAYLKNKDGFNMIEHIGEYKTGKIVNEGELGWEEFCKYKSSEVYCSRTGTKAKKKLLSHK